MLKKFLVSEAKKIPLEIIRRALKSWPKRCRLIYYNKGLQIETYKLGLKNWIKINCYQNCSKLFFTC